MTMNWIDSSALPQANDFPQWLTAERQKQSLAVAKHGLPKRNNEHWKYADLSFLSDAKFTVACDQHNIKLAAAVSSHKLQNADAITLVFVDGVFAPQYSDLAKLPESVTACSMQQAIAKHDEIIKQHFSYDIDAEKYPFAALNAALFIDGLFVHVPDGVELNVPLHVLTLSSGKESNLSNSHNLLVFGKNSSATIMPEYAGIAENSYFTNAMTTIAADENANVEIIKLQHENDKAIHMENFFIRQKKYSKVMLMNIATGARFSRDDAIVTLSEDGAECRTGGFYHAQQDGQYIDNHVNVDHIAPHTASEMLYKGLADKKSRAVFNGRLHVLKDAQKINAYQANHNLLLSNHAEVYSKPELEIYADDVRCKHGATTGQIDQDALFYMRARGINKEQAMKILLKGFADEVMERITHPAIKSQAKKQVGFI